MKETGHRNKRFGGAIISVNYYFNLFSFQVTIHNIDLRMGFSMVHENSNEVVDIRFENMTRDTHDSCKKLVILALIPLHLTMGWTHAANVKIS